MSSETNVATHPAANINADTTSPQQQPQVQPQPQSQSQSQPQNSSQSQNQDPSQPQQSSGVTSPQQQTRQQGRVQNYTHQPHTQQGNQQRPSGGRTFPHRDGHGTFLSSKPISGTDQSQATPGAKELVESFFSAIITKTWKTEKMSILPSFRLRVFAGTERKVYRMNMDTFSNLLRRYKGVYVFDFIMGSDDLQRKSVMFQIRTAMEKKAPESSDLTSTTPQEGWQRMVASGNMEQMVFSVVFNRFLQSLPETQSGEGQQESTEVWGVQHCIVEKQYNDIAYGAGSGIAGDTRTSSDHSGSRQQKMPGMASQRSTQQKPRGTPTQSNHGAIQPITEEQTEASQANKPVESVVVNQEIQQEEQPHLEQSSEQVMEQHTTQITTQSTKAEEQTASHQPAQQQSNQSVEHPQQARQPQMNPTKQTSHTQQSQPHQTSPKQPGVQQHRQQQSQSQTSPQSSASKQTSPPEKKTEQEQPSAPTTESKTPATTTISKSSPQLKAQPTSPSQTEAAKPSTATTSVKPETTPSSAASPRHPQQRNAKNKTSRQTTETETSGPASGASTPPTPRYTTGVIAFMEKAPEKGFDYSGFREYVTEFLTSIQITVEQSLYVNLEQKTNSYFIELHINPDLMLQKCQNAKSGIVLGENQYPIAATFKDHVLTLKKSDEISVQPKSGKKPFGKQPRRSTAPRSSGSGHSKTSGRSTPASGGSTPRHTQGRSNGSGNNSSGSSAISPSSSKS